MQGKLTMNQSVSLNYDVSAESGVTLDSTMLEDISSDKLSRNEFAVWSLKRNLNANVQTYLSLFTRSVAKYYNKLNSQRTLDNINSALKPEKPFSSLRDAQDAYTVANGKAYQLSDTERVTEPDVIRGIVESENVAGSSYASIADSFVKDVVKFRQFQGVVSDASKFACLEIGVNLWNNSPRNPHKAFVFGEVARPVKE
jgi:hypothetical protein